MTRPRTDVLVMSAIVAGWAATVAGSLAGWRHAMGHDHVIEGDGSLWVGVLVFVVGWQVMVAAMMLPSSLPAIRWFQSLDGVAEVPGRRLGAFLAGYAGIWTAVGLGALAADVPLHGASHHVGWLAARPWTITVSALVIAGAFQLSRWSQACREPEPVYVRASVGDRVSSGGAWRLGADHALVRLRECWPLMLVAFAFGMTSLAWMAGLTVLMTIERVPRFAPRAALGSGVGFLALAGLTVVHAGWLSAIPV